MAELSNWLEIPLGGEHPLSSSHLLQSRIQDVSPLFLPVEVREHLGLLGLEEAVRQGIYGPPEVARSILCNSQLFPSNEAESCSGDMDSLHGNEDQMDNSAHTPHGPDVLDFRARLEKALFDSSNVTRIAFLSAVAARVLFNWFPVPFAAKFATFYIILIAACANICAVETIVRSNFALSSTNALLHLTLLVASQLILPLPFNISSSNVTQVVALGLMLTSYVEPFFLRFVSQSCALSFVLLDGILSSHGDRVTRMDVCSAEPAISSRTALTLLLCLLLSSFMCETVKYTKRKPIVTKC